MMNHLFWIAFVAILYAHVGYSLLLMGLARFRNKTVHKDDVFPTVSVIVAVHNGEETVRAKIENTLELDYPQERLQVIVASDCSTDRTDEIVSGYGDRHVELVRLPRRAGKTAAENIAIKKALGEIIVFTDCSALIERKSLARIVRNFNDPEIGCVTSEDRDWGSSEGNGESLYVRYGTLLRRLESRIGSLIGASGSFYAVHRAIAVDLSPGFTRDLASSLLARKQGLRAVNEAHAWGYVKNIASLRQEFRRKVRTVVRGLTVLFAMREMLNPFKYGFYSLQLISHKLLKWLVPWFLVTIIAACVRSPDTLVCRIVLLFSVIFCSLAIIGAAMDRFGVRRRWLSIPAYLGGGILAVMVAWVIYVSGGQRAYWEPTKREHGGTRA